MTTSEVARNRVFAVPVQKAPRLRASDADRAVTVGLLQDAVARGMLSFDEGDERIAGAFGARHLDELPPLTADLPTPPPSAPEAPGWRRLGAMLGEQVHHEVRATRSAGIRSRRFVVAVLLAALLLAMVVIGALGGHDAGDGVGNGVGHTVGNGHRDFSGGWDDN